MNEALELRPEQPVDRPQIDLPRMFALAMEKGPEGVQMLKELVVLRREMEGEAAQKAYAAAMIKTQSEMPVAVKTSRNASNNSSYVKFEHLDQAARPVYQANGFSIEYSEIDCPIPDKIRLRAKVSHIAGHFECHHLDGSPDDVGPQGKPNKTKIQGQGSTFSYLQRYLLKLIFNIRTIGEDDDGQQGKQQPPAWASASKSGQSEPSGKQKPAAAPAAPPGDPLKLAKGRLSKALKRVGPDETPENLRTWMISEGIITADQRSNNMTAEQLNAAASKVEAWLEINS